jgi:hypothetical protein
MISCNRINSRGTAENSVYSNEPEKKGIINTDCNYYDKYGNTSGRLPKGQNIIILNGYFNNNFIDNDQDYYFDVAIEVKIPNYIDSSVWVQERYIDYSDNEELFTAWFKNKLLVSEYYYTATPEDIFYNRWGGYVSKKSEDDKNEYETYEARLAYYRAFYSKDTEDRLRISGKYFIVRLGGGGVTAFRLESVVKDGNIYTFNLTNRWYREIEVTLVDNGDGVTITQCNIILIGRMDISNVFDSDRVLNIKYVPYDKEKSEKTEASVSVWSNEQLKLLNSELAKW